MSAVSGPVVSLVSSSMLATVLSWLLHAALFCQVVDIVVGRLLRQLT
jgi:hypothetical protein